MIFQSMKMAAKAIWSNKMRSFLTMLGIIIGVFALVVLVSLVNGASDEITDSINSLGSNLISVSIMDDHSRPIKLADFQEFVSDDTVTYAAPVSQYSASASSDFAEKTAMIYGTTPSYMNIQNLKLESGRFLMTPDIDNNSNVVVINSDMANDVMGRTDVVGENIRLNGRQYQIIGVLEPEELSMSTMISGSYVAYIPYTSLVRLSGTSNLNVNMFYVSAEPENLDALEESINNRLKERFGDDDESFLVFNQSSIADAMDSVMGTLSVLLGGIAAISLLVGGIGIMNIMLVSVTERTREIGIRKAIGAGRATIMLQFLLEALTVSLIGCILGLIVSWVTLMLIDIIANVSYGMSFEVAVVAVIFSMTVGALFGIYPANKAAKMKPIDALRFS